MFVKSDVFRRHQCLNRRGWDVLECNVRPFLDEVSAEEDAVGTVHLGGHRILDLPKLVVGRERASEAQQHQHD